jgi:hypothetical protein
VRLLLELVLEGVSASGVSVGAVRVPQAYQEEGALLARGEQNEIDISFESIPAEGEGIVQILARHHILYVLQV